MTQEIIIALDEGTTNAKAVAVQQDGRVLAKASRPLTIQTPQQGWVEQSGEQLLSASLSVLAEVFAAVDPGKVAGIAISNQRETTIGWYRASGKPIHAAITWQCSRSAPFAINCTGTTVTSRSAPAPDYRLRRCFPPARCAGCSITCPMVSSSPSRERFALALSIAGCCGT